MPHTVVSSTTVANTIFSPTNLTDSSNEDQVYFDLYMYLLPLIALFGLSGNTISLVTIFHSRLRRVNANAYLIVLTIADSVFLAGIMLVCFKVDYISFYYCVGLEYVLMTSSYVSSWATAALTIERYLAIAHPLSHMRFGHVDRVKIMMYWVPIPFILQLFQFFSLEESEVDRKCALKEANYQIYAQVVDTLVCYLIPCGIIVILNTLVSVKVRRSQASFAESDKKNVSRRTGGSSSSSGTWTRILWVMPLVFVVLNTPFYVFMMIEIVLQVIYQSPPSPDTRSTLFMALYNTAHCMYYMNTAIDVLVYAFSSANFRKTAVIAWKRILCPGYADRQKGKVILTEQTSRYSNRMTSNRSIIRTSPTRADSTKSNNGTNDMNPSTVPLLNAEIDEIPKTSCASTNI